MGKVMEPRVEICARCGGRGTVHAASGPELEAARKSAGLTMRGLGAILGIKKSYVNQLEKELRTASPEMVDRWFSATQGGSHAKRR